METLTNKSSLTLSEAVDKIEELNKITGKNWSFKANKGTVKLLCN